jgi:hypothetical protein
MPCRTQPQASQESNSPHSFHFFRVEKPQATDGARRNSKTNTRLTRPAFYHARRLSCDHCPPPYRAFSPLFRWGPRLVLSIETRTCVATGAPLQTRPFPLQSNDVPFRRFQRYNHYQRGAHCCSSLLAHTVVALRSRGFGPGRLTASTKHWRDSSTCPSCFRRHPEPRQRLHPHSSLCRVKTQCLHTMARAPRANPSGTPCPRSTCLYQRMSPISS